jgi:hypothetical protein
LWALAAAALGAGPLDTGLAELNAAISARNLKTKYITELTLDPAESFRIEPFSSGGAYIRGGDVRGLMYGLMEAAEQIQANGRFAKTHSERGAALRGVRIELDDQLEHAPEEFWRSYFQMLAHNRFNRAHVVFPELVRPYRAACVISRAAAEAAVDFTLGVAGTIHSGEMGVLLALCPAVRSVAVEKSSTSQDEVFDAVGHAGHLVTVDNDGVSASRSAEGAAARQITPLHPPVAWPPSFEVRVPRDAIADPTGRNSHMAPLENRELFYWAWGRLGYDVNTKPPKGVAPAEYDALRSATLHIAAAAQADEGGSDHVASALEAVHNVQLGIASAKFTPLDIASRLESAASILMISASADMRMIGASAAERAREQRAAYAAALRASGGTITAKAESRAREAAEPKDRANVFYADVTSNAPVLTRPQILHKPFQGTAADKPMALTLRISPSKSSTKQTEPKLTVVRLHYRTLDPQSKETVLEEPAAPEVHFTIPGSDLAGSWDLFYYFEVLSAEGAGWFEPDPLAGAPYFTVHILAPRTGPN